MDIPFNKPFIVGEELYNIAKAVIKNGKLSGDGEFTRITQKWLEEKLHCKKVLLTHSCTAALEMSAILADITLGDEIIMPSFTFVSTANAFVLRGGIPVFVDIQPNSLCLDLKIVEKAVTERTKAIVAVHYAGVSCEMNELLQIAEKHNLLVIEDAAQALLSKYYNKALGTLGQLGTLSFHETKNIISGEGGALLINDEKYIERAEIIWEKGTDRKKFFRGQTDKYQWIDIGSSFLPSEIISAFLYAQLLHADEIVTTRQKHFQKYYALLKPLESKGCFRLPYTPDYSECNGHIFYLIAYSRHERDKLLGYLNSKGIYSIFHYIPLHSSPGGLRFAKTFGSLSVTDDISMRLLRLPLYYEMTEKDIIRIANAIKNFYSK